VALIALSTALAAHGADVATDTTGAASRVSELVVTANKRSERLQDVAMSVSAIKGQDLARNQTLDLQDLANQVPGLSLQQSGGNFTKIILRGQNAGGDGASVATVMDDVPLSFSGANNDGALLSTDFETYDLERVEVLRGPQGTLYGATAEGGLIKYVTNKPNPNVFRAGLEAGVYGLAHGDVGGAGKGYVNIPLLNGTAAIRASGFYESLPGWVDNKLLGGSKVNDGYRDGGRVAFLWKPTTDLTLRATAVLQSHISNGSDLLDVGGSAAPGARFQPVDGYNSNRHEEDSTRSKIALYALNIDYDFHSLRFQSITSYGIVHESYLVDETAYAGLYSSITGQSSFISDRDTHSLAKFNQEFRLSSEPGSTLFGHGFDWQAGGYYTHERVAFILNWDGLTFPGAVRLPEPLGTVYAFNVPSSYQDLAAYADATYHFTPKFDIEVGGRVAGNKQTSQVTEGGLLTGLPAVTTLSAIHTSETVLTYSVAPRYHLTSDVLLYGRVASGYRPGGPQLPLPGQPASVPSSFHSDSTVNYELGLKGQFLDRRVTVDLAAFYIDWSNVQIEQLVVANGHSYSITGNGGTAVSQGVEWDLNWIPVTGLTLGVIGAYTDAKLTQDAPGIGGLKGDRLAYVPDLSNTVNVDYEWRAFGDYRAYVGGGWTYTGSRYDDIPERDRLPSYSTVLLRAGLKTGRYSAEIYAKNIGDARGITNYVPTGSYSGGGSIAVIRPRTVGLRVAADF
jgi:outer membrane receptor protein involved in Fe transport